MYLGLQHQGEGAFGVMHGLVPVVLVIVAGAITADTLLLRLGSRFSHR